MVIHPRGNANRNPRLADGSRKADTLRMPVGVSICPMCKSVVNKLYDHKRGNIRMKLCGKCKERF